MNKLRLEYYRTAFLAISRNKRKGIYNNAKPILLLTIISEINNTITDNKIYFDEALHKAYHENFIQYYPNEKETPIVYPYYHLKFDGFWSLSTTTPTTFPHTPSDLFIRNHVNYASFDNALWDLLQDDECRTLLKNVLIQTFLTEK